MVIANRYILSIAFFLLSAISFSQTVKPFLYWTFDESNPYEDMFMKQTIRTSNCTVKTIDGGVGNGIDEGGGSVYSLFATNALKNNVKSEFSVEFLSNGGQINFTTYSDITLNISFQYPNFFFQTTDDADNGRNSNKLSVDLRGSGRKSYGYYSDGSWHHFVFTASSITGRKEIWVDGELLQSSFQTIAKNVKFIFGANDAFKGENQLDELAFYDKVLPVQLIKQHFSDFKNKQHYSFTVNEQLNEKQQMLSTAAQESVDPKEFAPGYPNYNVQALDQLKQFPLPRYSTDVNTNRNFSWMDITYLHRKYSDVNAKAFPPVDPQNAVALTDELAKYWNYYIEVPCLPRDSSSSNALYANSSSIYGSLIAYANGHTQFPVGTITFQAQITPANAGFDGAKNFENAQNLPDKYYLRNLNGQPITTGSKKWLSPLGSLDIIQKDGQTTQFYLRQLLKYLNNTPALINENGELFGHMRPDALLKSDPDVKRQMSAMKMNNAQYSGWFQYRLDSTYKSEVLKLSALKNANMSFYNVSAFNGEYWPDYVQRRKINQWSNGKVLSTPDFYPAAPDNWQNKNGPWNGYGEVARGRQKEIAMGDNRFSPFVAAGWQDEDQNIRPAQWLALLKSMVMLGADFFYVGYFNVTGANGKWPNGVGPNDPRGYIYQAAMPAYAQAIASMVPDFLNNGDLLNPNIGADKQFRFKTSKPNELILVRKLGKRYLIYGSIQPNSNIAGNVPQSSISTINLEDKKVSFESRRQGSMYILDVSGSTPIFYQLDKWHQYEHPYYWSQNTEIEAELFSTRKGNAKIKTEHNGDKYDFSSFTSFVALDKSASLKYNIQMRNAKTLHAQIIARGNGTIRIKSSESLTSVTINSSEFKMIKDVDIAGDSSEIEISCDSGNVEIDKIVVGDSNNK